jgi:hypothetical protein
MIGKLTGVPSMIARFERTGTAPGAWRVASRSPPQLKGESFTFDPGGNDGESGKSLLPMYLDIAKFVLGLAAASIVFGLFGSPNLGPSNTHPLKAFASPLFLVAASSIYGVIS